MCKRYKESMDHLFLHYEIPSAILSCVGLTWGMPRRVVDLFARWRRLSGSPPECSSIEDGTVMPFVVYLEGKK